MRQRVAGGMAERIDEKPRMIDNGEYYAKNVVFPKLTSVNLGKNRVFQTKSRTRDPPITSSEAPRIGYEGDS